MLMLFDYDGVIADSVDYLLDLCVQAQSSLGSGRPPVRDDLRTIESLTFHDLGRLIGMPEEHVMTYAERVLALQKRQWPVVPFPGMVEVLSALAEAHTVAVITASQGEIVSASLRKYGLGGAIAGVLGGDLGIGKAERITSLQTRYAYSSRDTLMTGDAISDIREGKRAGVRTAAVAWGYQDLALLAGENPDFVVRQPRDLLKLAAALAGD